MLSTAEKVCAQKCFSEVGREKTLTVISFKYATCVIFMSVGCRRSVLSFGQECQKQKQHFSRGSRVWAMFGFEIESDFCATSALVGAP